MDDAVGAAAELELRVPEQTANEGTSARIRGRFRSRTPAAEEGARPGGAPPPAALKRDALYRRTLAAVDVASAALGLSLGILVVGDRTPELLMLAALPLVVLVNKVVG